MSAKDGREQIAAAMANFPNLMPDTIDLTDWMSEDTVHRIKNAQEYREQLLKFIKDDHQAGRKMSFQGARKFAFRPGEMTVWAGYKGHGKSLFISQIFLEFMNAQDKVFIVSPEFKPHEVINRMIWQGNEGPYSVTDMDDWLRVLANYLWLYDLQGSLKPGEVVALCRYAAEKLGIKHILIDSLMKCGIPPDDYQGQKRLVDDLQNIAHRTGVHLHLVAHARKGSSDHQAGGIHDIKGTSEIGDMAENVIVVWRNKLKEQERGKHEAEPDAVVKFEAQRNGTGWIGSLSLLYDDNTKNFREMGA